jgi:probable rRNA maturation factor
MSLRIHFHPLVEPPSEFDPFPVQTLASLLAEEGLEVGTVNCILTDDGDLARLNERFRAKPGPTDVLAFPYELEQSGGAIGDIYVSVDRAREQATRASESIERELCRLFVHGALHLAGYDHDTESADRAMREKQEQWVQRAVTEAV